MVDMQSSMVCTIDRVSMGVVVAATMWGIFVINVCQEEVVGRVIWRLEAGHRFLPQAVDNLFENRVSKMIPNLVDQRVYVPEFFMNF